MNKACVDMFLVCLQKEALHFEIHPDDYPADMSHVILEIKKVNSDLFTDITEPSTMDFG